MKLTFAILASGIIGGGLGAALVPRVGGDGAKIQALDPLHFKELGTKRVKITYGPYNVSGAKDNATHGMQMFADMQASMPCRNCLILGYVPDLVFEDGTTANANQGMWLHHIGLMNLNRSDAACLDWPERMNVNGNERSPFDFTVNGTRKAGYYLREGDQIFLTTEVMNMSDGPVPLYLSMVWEYIEGTPNDFDVVFPVWLDVKGNCLNQRTGIVPKDPVFNVSMTSGWSPPWAGDLILAVPHIHDGNVKQEVYLDGKLACQSIPGYGEKPEYITHLDGPDNDGDMDMVGQMKQEEHQHIQHVSSITQCSNLGKVGPSSKFTITSFYNMTAHTAMKDWDGSFEPIMGIQFLHLARPKDEAIKDILAGKPGNLTSFTDQVAANTGKTG